MVGIFPQSLISGLAMSIPKQRLTNADALNARNSHCVRCGRSIVWGLLGSSRTYFCLPSFTGKMASIHVELRVSRTFVRKRVNHGG